MQYTINEYLSDIKKLGLSKTWNIILSNDENKKVDISDVGKYYEIGLAYSNSNKREKNGQYYTPNDVTELMADFFSDLRGENICDVCCGTGNLILAVLAKMRKSRAIKMLSSGKVFLYDNDSLALRICVHLLEETYGVSIPENNIINKNFMTQHLPENSKVISNPPYFKLDKIPRQWGKNEVASTSKEIYACIMDKILKESVSSVIITPFTFMSGIKFYPLRQIMNEHNGFIIPFDNIPAQIFNWEKWGSKNTNKSNSVRAAITVTENTGKRKGYCCSSLIRFKCAEREGVLKKDFLKSQIGTKRQIISPEHPRYAKCSPELEQTLSLWEKTSDNNPLIDLMDDNGRFKIYVPTSCRYFVTASVKNLKRTGKMIFKFPDERKRAYAYCMINSSFCYWYWRLYDGGITCPVWVIKDLPCFYDCLSDDVINSFVNIFERMHRAEKNYMVGKKNAGVIQENIKFPKRYRKEIDKIILSVIGSTESPDIFQSVYSNSAFEGGKF